MGLEPLWSPPLENMAFLRLPALCLFTLPPRSHETIRMQPSRQHGETTRMWREQGCTTRTQCPVPGCPVHWLVSLSEALDTTLLGTTSLPFGLKNGHTHSVCQLFRTELSPADPL